MMEITKTQIFLVVGFVGRDGKSCDYANCSIVMLQSDEGLSLPRAKSDLFPVEVGDKLRETTKILRIQSHDDLSRH